MNIETLVKANATHVRVTQLSVGDVFKRLNEPSYGSPELKYGVVTGILSDGDTTVVTALELNDGYAVSDRLSERVMKSGDQEAIFPATPEEIRLVTSRVVERADEDAQRASRDLERKKDQMKNLESLVEKLHNGELSATAYEALEGENA